MSDQMPISIELSADGRRNGYYHRCRIVEQNRPYAGCLARLRSELTGDPDCDSAIRNCSCPAISMRKEEEEEGKALFFVERSEISKFIGKVKNWILPEKIERETDRQKTSDMLSQIEEGSKLDNAALINKLMADRKQAPSKIELLPDETPLQAIKRIKNDARPKD